MKKFLCLFGICAVLSTAAYAETPISVTVDGSKLAFDVNPVTESDRTLVPMRAIFEALDAEVSWDDVTNTAVAVRGNTEIKITIDSKIMYKNGESLTLDVPARLISDRTLVPIRAVSEGLGADVDWDEAAACVIIATKKNEEQPSIPEEPIKEPGAEEKEDEEIGAETEKIVKIGTIASVSVEEGRFKITYKENNMLSGATIYFDPKNREMSSSLSVGDDVAVYCSDKDGKLFCDEIADPDRDPVSVKISNAVYNSSFMKIDYSIFNAKGEAIDPGCGKIKITVNDTENDIGELNKSFFDENAVGSASNQIQKKSAVSLKSFSDTVAIKTTASKKFKISALYKYSNMRIRLTDEFEYVLE